MKMIIRNLTRYKVDLMKLSAIQSLRPNEEVEVILTSRNTIHGHADIGSFLINKRDNSITVKTWGKVVMMNPEDQIKIYEILEKR